MTATTLLDEARELIRRGLPIVATGGRDGKNPDINGKGWHKRRFTIEEISRALRGESNPGLGLILGPDAGYIDIEADGPEEEELFAKLFAGCEPPITPTYKSSRGKHRLFRFDERLKDTGRAVVHFRNGGKAKLGCRIGAGGLGAQSVIPPSAGREWLVSWDDVEPATLPDSVVAKILAAVQPKAAPKPAGTASGGVVDRARKYLAEIPPAVSGQGGHDATFHAACILVCGFSLDRGPALELLREWNISCEPPWTDAELEHKIDDAINQPGERGYLLSGGAAAVIANFTAEEIQDDDGEKRTVSVPRSMTEIIDDINQRMDNWPRRIDNVLFVDDPGHGIDWFDKRTTAGLFGWLRRHNKVQWAKGGSFVSQAELFAEIERTTKRYEAIELLPHEPPLAGIYYRGTTPQPGDGTHLRRLLDRFRPETTIDRDLIQAAMMTAFWGGLPGCRPAFVVTSDDGRGVGKSKVPEVVGYLCGGHIDVSANENIETLKTRMLTPGARTKRIVLMDNVKSLRLSWAELEAMITAPLISGRQLYIGEGQRPNLLTWFITLNGVSMATDMAQRSVIIKVVRGTNDGPWWEQTRDYIDQHRQQLIGDIIGALRAEPFRLAEFTRWATWEQHVLSRLPEPGEAQRLIQERQGQANCELEEAEIIEDYFAEQLRQLEYEPTIAQVRIPVEVTARWYGDAVGEKAKTAGVTRKLKQMADEGQLKRIAPDTSRTYGRCFVWTGENADVVTQSIVNDLKCRIERKSDRRW